MQLSLSEYKSLLRHMWSLVVTYDKAKSLYATW